MTPEPDRPSWRRPAGAFLILLLIALWAGLVAGLADAVGRWPIAAQTIFYAVAGLAWIWVLPLRRILRWSQTGRWR